MYLYYTHNKHKAVDANIIKSYATFVMQFQELIFGTIFAALLNTKAIAFIFFNYYIYLLGHIFNISQRKST